ncbi:hypothetical protein [Paracoccus sp. PARArs4]|uniref:hypothetical protein n=1 Tax=Paracoccus sp. PARArs4 TaxID=2853442 RepID=UPI0024A657F7|nr:hypothetical protein [Paracoccus sp. PARArs4]
MIAYRHVTTFGVTQQRWLSSISDLLVAEIGGERILLAATQIGGGVSSYRIGAGDAAITGLRNRDYPGGATYQGAPELHLLDIGGQAHVHLGGLGGLSDLSVDLQSHNGALTSFSRLFGTDLGARLTALGQVTTTRGEVVFSAAEGLVLRTHMMDAAGRLSQAGSVTLPLPQGATDANLDHVVAANVGGQVVLVTASGNGNFLSTHPMGADGRLGAGHVHSAASGAGFDLPSALALAEFGGASFAILGAAGSNSLSVFRIGQDGSLTRADHVLDEGGTRFASVTALEVVVVDGRAFVFAGGADDGISVMTMTPDGRLVHLATIADEAATTLADVSDITAVEIDGRIAVFVASATETGVTQFLFDPGDLGVTRIAGAGTQGGGAGNDLLQAGAATLRLNGGGGDDILIAAGSPLLMHGGDGADIFMPTSISGRITILDFRRGVDAIDFSLLGTVRSVWQLSFVPTSTGILIIWGQTILDVRSWDGRSLQASDFTNAMFPLAHYSLPEIDPEDVSPDDTPSDVATWIFGTEGNDTLLGASGPERIVGAGGNDTISAGDGGKTRF